MHDFDDVRDRESERRRAINLLKTYTYIVEIGKELELTHKGRKQLQKILDKKVEKVLATRGWSKMQEKQARLELLQEVQRVHRNEVEYMIHMYSHFLVV